MLNQLKKVTLVNEKDEVIGEGELLEAHRGSGKLHRAISVFLFNDNDEVLLQKRSVKKIVGASQWANTCCGNVRPGESYEECAYRRLYEELGIEGIALIPICKFEYQIRCNEEFSEHEMDTVFTGKFNGEIKPNPEEVSEYKWMRKDDLILEWKKNKNQFVPWLPFLLEQKEVIRNLQK